MSTILINPFGTFGGGGGGGGGTITAVQTDHRDIDNSGFSSKVFTGSTMAIGTADANRYVVACFSIRSYDFNAANRFGEAGETLAVTIGGVSATIVAQQSVDQATYYSFLSCIAVANVPTGTTADIVLTITRSANVQGIHGKYSTYVLTGYSGGTTDGDTALVSSNDTLAMEVAVAEGGCVITTAEHADPTSATPTGVAVDDSGVNDGDIFVTASADELSADATYAVSILFASADHGAAAAASFAP